jgi:hypothetical protein
MMDKPTDTGMNRTGIATSPIDSERTISAAEAADTASPLDGSLLEAERTRWSRDADPLGTVPPPGTLKGIAKTLLEKLQGRQPNVFIDKLGERLAYERTGTRLYDALLAKFEAANVHEGGPTRADLEKHRNDEHHHFLLVCDAIRQLGADPTAITPCADVVAVAGLGWVQILTDPRTTFTQCLDVMLIIEQGDVAGWELLTELATSLGFDDLADQFRAANVIEEEHAAHLKAWVTQALLGQVGTEPTPPLDVNNPAPP